MKRGTRRHSPALVALAVLAAISLPHGARAAGMNDYCQVPPYVIQNVAPNVMLLIDSSASMLEFAYYDGYNTISTVDDFKCSALEPCTEFDAPGAYPDHKYYGYFDPDVWYRYTANRFILAGPKSGTRPANSWDGNFLNWLTMRKLDVMRKVLTGGTTTGGEGSGFDKLVGEQGAAALDGWYKVYGNAAAVTPFSGNKSFTFNLGATAATSQFAVSGVAGTFNVAVKVPAPVEGILQSDVGARARMGLSFFKNGGDGAYVDIPIASASLVSVVQRINLNRPSTGTPAGEALWSMAGYFAQQATFASYGAPGPRYSGGDYTIGPSNDPLNFGSVGQGRWPICSKSFVLLISDGEPCGDGNLPGGVSNYASGRSAFNCADNVCREGNTALTDNGASFNIGAFTDNAAIESVGCGLGGTVAGLEDVALFAHTNDLRNAPTLGTDNIARTQNLTLYTVFGFGSNSRILKYAALNGGFEDGDGSGTPNRRSEWDTNLDNVPDTYFEATEGAELEEKIKEAFASILKRASSGTAASVLASGEGSGANLVQAVFYPRRRFGNDVVAWTGSLQNLWYFVDPFLLNASIREETTPDTPYPTLNLANDYIAEFFFDTAAELTKVRRFVDSDGNGTPNAAASPAEVGFEDLKNIWEAGDLLRRRDVAASARTIFTTVDGANLIPFHADNVAQITLTNLQADNTAEAVKIIDFVRGVDIFQDANTDQVNDYRLRTGTFGSDNAVWRMGDIVNSTPRIVGGIPLNTYDRTYRDTTYRVFTDNTLYKNRGMVFAGGNDGMLHAFKHGKLSQSWVGKSATEKARLEGTSLGNEQWAFIPKNALPYLKYMMDPDYCHLYYVDLSPYVFDASINGNPGDVRTPSSWRSVLIGGMRTGGACKNLGTACSDCVKTPVNNVGYSSYFALDVTDPENPDLLWEFSDPALGFATTGPAVVRLNAINAGTGQHDRTLNGHWYVVFGSGPTGGIDNVNNQFLGRSSQNMSLFIRDLETGALVRTIDTEIENAFAGSMINSVADVDQDYSDDAVYFGFVRKDISTNQWTQGGVGRLFTKGDTTPGVPDWEFSRVVDDIGPVTSSVARLQNDIYHANWLFFGTGRFYFEQPASGTETEPVVDDGAATRSLFGIKEPCFTILNTLDTACTTLQSPSFSPTSTVWRDVSDVADVPAEALANSAGFNGWRIALDNTGTYSYDSVSRLYRAERVITDPLATTSGLVFFTTYKPYGDECALGGKSFLWAVRYNTGGAAPPGVLKGKALVQVSTASVEQIDLSAAFEGDAGIHRSGRRTFAIEGVPPTAQGLSILAPPPPVRRLLHMRER